MHLPIHSRKYFDKTLDSCAKRLQNEDMAITEIRTDDLNGEPEAERITFSFQGTDYSIDLAKENLDIFTENLSDFIAKATVLTKAKATRGTRTKGASNYDTAAVRAWALTNGFPDIPKRGRISADILAAYEAAAA